MIHIWFSSIFSNLLIVSLEVYNKNTYHFPNNLNYITITL